MSVHKASSFQHKLFRAALRVFEASVSVISRNAYLKMAVEMAEEMDRIVEVNTGRGIIRFQCNSEIARIRANGMMNREPDTIAWIDGFGENDCFLDIGSNIGVFALYAAVIRRVEVVACDPLPQNHYSLNENAKINGVSDRITMICAALNDCAQVADLMVPAVADTSGGAGATFGESYDNYQRDIAVAYRLRTIGTSVDDLVERFGARVPNHIKMDIDGIQDKVIVGARNTLRNPAVKSVMLELQPINDPHNRKVHDTILQSMVESGFRLDKVAAATPNMTTDKLKFPTNNFFVR